MALADYEPATAKVEFRRGSFTVRGLSLDDVTLLMGNHALDLDKVVSIYADNVKPELAVMAMAQYSMALIKEAPGLAANILALACDEPDQVDKARALPMGTQLDALTKVMQLTFEEAGGPKKLWTSLTTFFKSVAPGPLKTDSAT